MDEFAWLTQGFLLPRGSLPDLVRFGDRKARLFGCACARLLWHLLENTYSRSAVVAAERFAEGQIAEAELRRALAAAKLYHRFRRMRAAVYPVPRSASSSPAGRAGADATLRAAGVACTPPPTDGAWLGWAVSLAHNTTVAHWDGVRAAAYRAGVQPPTAGLEDARALVRRLAACVFGSPSRPLLIDPAWLAWNGGTVRKMAEVIYTQRSWGDLPVLADALEESGCADDALLGHLRGPGPHALGCHALDALLGGTPGSAPPGVAET